MTSVGFTLTILVLPLAAPALAGPGPADREAEVVADAIGAPTVSDTLVLTGVHVVSVRDDTVDRDRALVIADGRIVRIDRADGAAPGPGAEVHDLAGAYVLPGLVDAHVHLREPPASLVLFPAAGVTTVVNLEGDPAHLALRDSVIANASFAPTILSSGPYLERRVESPAEAREEVRRQRAAGYDLVKIHGAMEEDVFLAAVDEAAAQGLPVLAHYPGDLDPSTVLGSGLAALAHAEELLGAPLLEVPEGAAEDPVSAGGAVAAGDSVLAVARAVVESRTALITTLAFFTGMRDQATDRFHRMIVRPELAWVSPARRHAWLYDGHREYIGPEDMPWYDAAVEIVHRLTGAVHAGGGLVVAGTDTPLEFTVPGFSLHDELDHLVRAGLTPREALRAATAAPAELLGRNDLGRIAPGAVADLVVVGSDPTESLDALERIRGVVLRGRWHPASEIRRELDALAARYAREEVTRAARVRVLDELEERIETEGVADLEGEVRRLRESFPTTAPDEGDLNALGYRRLGEGDVDTAIAVFRLNVRLHPGSANVHDSLGEAYLAAGDLDRAEASYRRALEMDPTLGSARRALEEIAERRR